jgi:hypothetical protein
MEIFVEPEPTKAGRADYKVRYGCHVCPWAEEFNAPTYRQTKL